MPGSYRRVLREPGVPASLLLMFFNRLPMTAMGLTLTLYVVSELGRGYGAAGLVGTATMIGTAVGAPTVGRMIDKHGLRPVVAVCGLASTAFWVGAPHLPYLVLLVVAFPAGMLTVPAGSIARQVLAALVPKTERRAAYSLDTISLETTYMLGPPLGILISTQWSAAAALTAIGCCFGVFSTLLWLVNPPVRSEEETATAPSARPPLREWLTARLTATYLVASGALFVLIGTEVAVLAAMRETGQVGWTSVVIAVMCVASLAGGIVHGAVRKSLPQQTLMLLLTLLVLPAGWFHQQWWLLALALIPTNLVCAPTLAATTESVSSLAPARVRGEAMGLQDTATRIGLALGTPVVGFVMDRTSPGLGFAAAGAGGLVFAGAAAVIRARGRKSAPSKEVADA